MLIEEVGQTQSMQGPNRNDLFSFLMAEDI